MKANRAQLYPDRIFNFIRVTIQQTGQAPTYAEIANQFDCGLTSVYDQISKLVNAGKIRRTPNVTRGLSLVTEN